jgi:hypothetical protein
MKLHGISIDEKMLWERDGYLVLDGFLSEQEVAYYNERMDNAFVQFRHKGKANHELAQLKHVEQISGIIEEDDAFLELMEHPRMMNILRDLIGNSFVMIDNDALIKPPKKEAHTNWHRDTSSWLGGKKSPLENTQNSGGQISSHDCEGFARTLSFRSD